MKENRHFILPYRAVFSDTSITKILLDVDYPYTNNSLYGLDKTLPFLEDPLWDVCDHARNRPVDASNSTLVNTGLYDEIGVATYPLIEIHDQGVTTLRLSHESEVHGFRIKPVTITRPVAGRIPMPHVIWMTTPDSEPKFSNLIGLAVAMETQSYINYPLHLTIPALTDPAKFDNLVARVIFRAKEVGIGKYEVLVFPQGFMYSAVGASSATYFAPIVPVLNLGTFYTGTLRPVNLIESFLSAVDQFVDLEIGFDKTCDDCAMTYSTLDPMSLDRLILAGTSKCSNCHSGADFSQFNHPPPAPF